MIDIIIILAIIFLMSIFKAQKKAYDRNGHKLSFFYSAISTTK